MKKHQIFANAPELDPDGDHLVIRFNRKDGSHTLSAEAKGKKKKLFLLMRDNHLNTMLEHLKEQSIQMSITLEIFQNI